MSSRHNVAAPFASFQGLVWACFLGRLCCAFLAPFPGFVGGFVFDVPFFMPCVVPFAGCVGGFNFGGAFCCPSL